jgi:hypothetical protein
MVQALLQYNGPVNIFENEHGGSPMGWGVARLYERLGARKR